MCVHGKVMNITRPWMVLQWCRCGQGLSGIGASINLFDSTSVMLVCSRTQLIGGRQKACAADQLNQISFFLTANILEMVKSGPDSPYLTRRMYTRIHNTTGDSLSIMASKRAVPQLLELFNAGLTDATVCHPRPISQIHKVGLVSAHQSPSARFQVSLATVTLKIFYRTKLSTENVSSLLDIDHGHYIRRGVDFRLGSCCCAGWLAVSPYILLPAVH